MGAVVVVVLVALAVTVGIGIFRGQSAPTQAVTIDESPAATPGTGDMYVHVAGAVRQPGLYLLPDGSRLVDAVAAAGGFAKDAARDGVNLARPVSDGEQVVVPREGEEPEDAASGTAPDGTVNLNTADQAALETLPRIGPALAQRIIQWREQNGRFTSVDDLLAVSGIGEKLLAGIRDQVTI
ncbi:ComEA family DNA-binding protein [Microbacterium protaetiae]|uniref:ComEA family DNA-binding protein n=1 Tax=Microbacterium protaetiae TaxID=2509458 RepID=A0A4P6EHH2_9MICO|nr:ComEA family DNA-binding protein [Microbacterium protaetiae]